MNQDESDDELLHLYRNAAREHTAPEVDRRILQVARKHAWRTQLPRQLRFVAVAAALCLMLLIPHLYRERPPSTDTLSVSASLKAATSDYLLRMRPMASSMPDVNGYLINQKVPFIQPAADDESSP